MSSIPGDRLHLVHCTSVERGRSIAREGLLPGTQERCNYDCNRWMPLEGVYLSQSSLQIERYRLAHSLDDCAIVLVGADPADLLPDEDLVDHFLAASYRTVAGLGRDICVHDHEPPDPGDPFWIRIRDQFRRDMSPFSLGDVDVAMLDDLVEWWADFEFFGDGGDIDPFEWADLKDRVVRAYPRMEGLALAERSKRHPGKIAFEGRTRILAVVLSRRGEATLIMGEVPEDACNLVRSMTGTLEILREEA